MADSKSTLPNKWHCALCNQNFEVKFVGDKSLSKRNMYEIIKILRQMGAKINS